MVATNGTHKVRDKVRSSIVNVRKMISLGMPSRKVEKRGSILTLVKVHPSWRHLESWQSIRAIYAALPEDN